jgi:MYXO-CTERM domain-containing protein
VSYGEPIAGLTPGTTYYFCALASSSAGTGFGSVLSFTTPSIAPVVQTLAATVTDSQSAVLNANANPSGGAAIGWFRYAPVNPGTCDDSFGTRIPAMGGVPLGSGNSAVPYSQSIGGLTPGTTYYFCALASNLNGTAVGAVLSFNTAAPTVVTTPATAITSTAATLNGTANPNLTASTGWFRYSSTDPGSCSDSFGTRAPAMGGTALGAGSTPVAYSQPITGLAPGTTFYYCAIASSSSGTSFGDVLSFSTVGAPIVTTEAVTGLTSIGATLNGSANPSSASATGWFRYSTTNPGSCNDAFGTRAPTNGGTALGAGSTPVPYSQTIGGLVPGSTYYYCAIASNATGTGFGAVLSFTTPAAPTVVTVAASGVTSTSATLNGTANPNGTATTGWFRYDTTSPGTCNDAFGTRAPVMGGTAVGAGSAPVSYSEPLSGLQPSTTYFYCAIGQSAIATSFGSVMSFTTTDVPAVVTAAASAVSSTGATLNGTGDPNFSAATGWFRYDTESPGICNDSFGTRAPAVGGTALGSGTAPVSFSQALSGLTAGTTYYFCAIASNAVGTGFGTVMSFTTTSVPNVVTAAATAVSSTAATLNGSANPNASASTGWFRYSATDPGACNDSFGTRAPAVGGTALGAGSTAVAYSQAPSGLTAGTTYYFCAIASNAAGTGFGSVLTFVTPAAPTVATVSATNVTSTSALLDGSANPQFAAATGWFRYDTVNPGTCNDAFGTRAPAMGGSALGAGSTPVAYSQPVSGLAPGTTYYFCAIASNSVGTGLGTVQSFTTTAAPIVTTVAASGVTSTGASLNGTGDPNLASATGWFRYDTVDPGACNDVFGTRAPAIGGSVLGAGTAAVPYAQAITDLSPGTTYYFCAIASNAAGTGFGSVLSFTTPAAPAVTTAPATAVSGTTATLNGSANPSLSSTTGWFRYSAFDPGTCDDVFGTRAPAVGGTGLGAGNAPVAYSQTVNGLAPDTTYYFCAIASNAGGTSFGSVLSFTTPGAPDVITEPATLVTSTTALLNATAIPNLSSAQGWFRYATTTPGACNDNFGTRAPLNGSSALGAGSSPVAYAQPALALTADTTYYYCAIAENSVGKSFGVVMSFTTAPPQAPIVTTEAASAIQSDGATLNGSASPGAAATIGWFRYSEIEPAQCDDGFGTRAPQNGGSSLGAGVADVGYEETITGLAPATTYYYCAIAENAVDLGFGEVLSFTTPAAEPIVTTLPPTAVSFDSAELNGEAIPNGDATLAWFRYSATEPAQCNDSFGTATAPIDLGNGLDDVAFQDVIGDLSPKETYYYCAIAENGEGIAFGEVLSFSPEAVAPVVTTEPATDVTDVEATLVGTANPNAATTTAWFRIGDEDPGDCSDAFGERVPQRGGTSIEAGTGAVEFTEALAELEPNATYYYCAAAENLGGAAFGEVLSFTTEAVPPVVTTVSAVPEPAGSLTLSGEADPRGAESIGWFRYGTEDPGDCNDEYGTRVPAEDGTALGGGREAVPFSETAADVEPGTYYACAIASNEAGTAFGEVVVVIVPGDGDAPPAPPPLEDDGCSCRIAGERRTSPVLLLSTLLLVALAARRRRR